MSSPLQRFEFRFKAYTSRSIRLLLSDSQGVAATILICCAIDLAAKYFSGDASFQNNKSKYVAFIDKYFPSHYDATSFYSFVRCGLLHGFSMENEYLILCSNEKWALNAHLQVDPKSGCTVINPFILHRDLSRAFLAYVSDIRSDNELHERFQRVHSKLPLKQQQRSWRKLKGLSQNNSA